MLAASTRARKFAAALSRLAEHAARWLAVIDDPDAIYWLERSTLRHLLAFAVRAIDTLGAGDVYHASFTLALVEGRTLAQALRFAAAVAALKCTRFGGAASAPQRTEVEAFLADNRRAIRLD